MSIKIINLIGFVTILFACNNKALEKSTANKGEKDTNNAKPQNVSKDFLLGRFDYETHKDFVLMSSEWSDKDIYLQQETNSAFEKMARAAQSEGIDLVVVSGTRNFDEQKRIWQKKWGKNKLEDPIERARDILSYSAMPSTSRHHWGTDIDINSVENEYFESGRGKEVYQWLASNAAKYGFKQVYTNKKEPKRTGYNEEPWHWSYMPLASKFLSSYVQTIQYTDINGFQGSELAKELKMIENYVKGINTD